MLQINLPSVQEAAAIPSGTLGLCQGPARPQILAIKRGGGEGANLISSVQMRGEFLPLWGTGRGIVNFGMSRENLGATAGLGHGDSQELLTQAPGHCRG